MERIARTTYETGQRQTQEKFIEVQIKPGIIINFFRTCYYDYFITLFVNLMYLFLGLIQFTRRLEKWHENYLSQ
jgi:hypothetical protein